MSDTSFFVAGGWVSGGSCVMAACLLVGVAATAQLVISKRFGEERRDDEGEEAEGGKKLQEEGSCRSFGWVRPACCGVGGVEWGGVGVIISTPPPPPHTHT